MLLFDGFSNCVTRASLYHKARKKDSARNKKQDSPIGALLEYKNRMSPAAHPVCFY